MANGVWKGVHLHVFGRSRQLSINMFFYKNTFFEKSIQLIGNLGKKKEKNGGGRKKIMLEIMGITSLPVDRLITDGFQCRRLFQLI